MDEKKFIDQLRGLRPGPAPGRLDRVVLTPRQGPARNRRGRPWLAALAAAAVLLLFAGAARFLWGGSGASDFRRRTEEQSLRHALAARRALLQVRLARLRRTAAGVDGAILGDIDALRRELERIEPPPPLQGEQGKTKEETGVTRERGESRNA